MGDVSFAPPPIASETSQTSNKLELLIDEKCFGGRQQVIRHFSAQTMCSMKFSIYIPKMENSDEKFHVVFFLPGIMCNEQNFLFRTGFQKYANEQRLIVVGTDTSPRCQFPGDRESPVFGRSAGWYLDATEEPWNANYRMYSYVSQELPEIIAENFPTTGKFGLCGHSMGGNGALVIGLRNPNKFLCISLLAPSSNPTSWGHEKIFKKYLGDNEALWKHYDAFHVASAYNGPTRNIIIDQGGMDEYLEYLKPVCLHECAKSNASLNVNFQVHDGYDHSYYFVAAFIEKHLRYHKNALDNYDVSQNECSSVFLKN